MCGCVDLGEKVAFAPEPLLAGAPHQRDVQQLDRRASLEAAVAALRQPDAAHPALADGRDQPVGADDLSLQRRRVGGGLNAGQSRPPETRTACRPLVLGEQALQVGAERRVACAIAASQAARRSPVIASASSRYGLSARQRSGLSGGTGPHRDPTLVAVHRNSAR